MPRAAAILAATKQWWCMWQITVSPFMEASEVRRWDAETTEKIMFSHVLLQHFATSGQDLGIRHHDTPAFFMLCVAASRPL